MSITMSPIRSRTRCEIKIANIFVVLLYTILCRRNNIISGLCRHKGPHQYYVIIVGEGGRRSAKIMKQIL